MAESAVGYVGKACAFISTKNDWTRVRDTTSGVGGLLPNDYASRGIVDRLCFVGGYSRNTAPIISRPSLLVL